jgi:biopolymer transport protein ExbD
MSRRKKGLQQEDDEPGLDISSLIDVCFLLLIYFLVTSTIQPREQDLPMTLPSSQKSDAPLEIEPMLIAVKKTGSGFSIVVNKTEVLDTAVQGKERKLPRLFESLDAYSSLANANDTKPLVQLYIDPSVEQQTAMDVLNCLKGAGINSVTFAVTAE